MQKEFLMKNLFIFSTVLAVVLAACGDDSSTFTSPADSEFDSSSSVEKTQSSSSVEQGSSPSKGVSSSSKEKAKSSSSVAEQESSSSEKVPSSSVVVEESSSSKSGDATTVNSSSFTEVTSSSSGSENLDVQISKDGFLAINRYGEPQVTTKVYMQPDSSGRISGTMWYVVENCRVDGATLSKTVSGDTLVLKYVDWMVASDCEHWADITISYKPELDYIKYIDYSSPYCKHNVYEVVREPDPGKPLMPWSSSSMSLWERVSSMMAERSSSSSTGSQAVP